MDSRFSHMVYFTLKDHSDDACQQLVAACQKYLDQHPGTEFFAAGTIADTDREVVDKDYHVSLHLIFRNRAAHDAYQVATRHEEFIAEQNDNWQRVRVFDADLAN